MQLNGIKFKKTLIALVVVFGSIPIGITMASSDLPIDSPDLHQSVKEVAETVLIRKISTHKKVVALTFDDGPSAKFTPVIMDVLWKYQVKATFFVIGYRAEKFPELIAMEINHHFQVGNHSFQHKIMTGNSQSDIYKEMMNAQHAIESAAGHKPQPRMFRPPRGRLNEKIVKVANQQHYKIIMWSIDSRDWENPGVGKIVKRVLSQVQNGDIILFHDQGGSRMQTVESLKAIIPALKKRGFELVTVSELVNLANNKR